MSKRIKVKDNSIKKKSDIHMRETTTKNYMKNVTDIANKANK